MGGIKNVIKRRLSVNVQKPKEQSSTLVTNKREEPSLKTDIFESSTTEHRWDSMIGIGDFWGRDYYRIFNPELLKEVLFSIAKEEQRFFIGKRCLIDIETNDDEDIFDDDDLEYDAEIGKAEQSSNQYLNRICLVAGSPMFDKNVCKELQNLGFKREGIITFECCS